ncbi:hypothetical protein HOR97_gp02 [Agrobacterium phage Atu_ph03]|uniref:Uncharacterized protein n=2 Tax=Atuphduovirus TaxID=2731928 RepID=A0A2L0UYX5_9CAUD|nr:hypothetical protein HOR96_gp02 [Agrobacterium phage Atu_ph02]YP_009791843.1 hypothetical protein HOR97_gp02 [Agrobacterium phage Atu_ph03]AUZ94728.1 hypothetical protein [Agrobacterium phage Atu_ph02]AUZ94765.1 hypothetical protein [Agrobacterium phage Atu_ph03]
MNNISRTLALVTMAGVARSTDDDLLGDLGLEDNATAPTADAAAPAADAAAKTEREEVKIGELEAVSFDAIPPQRRGGGASGSKYKFETIAAPVAKDGGGYSYSGTLVRLVEGEDADKLKRSVQSATTQANAKAKEDGAVERFITRQHVEKGEFAGVYIIRVDGTQDVEEAAE